MKQYPVQTVALPNGETVAYRSAGDSGPVVLLIHGNMSSSVHWQTTLQALEDSCRLYAPDMRGFGESSYNSRFDSLRELAEDLEAFVDAVGVDSFSVVGWSTGGGVAMEMAADMPDRVEKLLLLDSAPLTGYPMFKKDEQGQPILTQLLKTKEEVAADPVQVVPALAALQKGDRETMRYLWNLTIYNVKQPPAEDYELYLDGIMLQRNLVDVDYSLLTFNMTDAPTGSAPGSGRGRLIRCPVVVMQGEKDIVVPLAWAQTIKDFFGPQASLIVFPGAGHSAITDDPGLFFKTLRDNLL